MTTWVLRSFFSCAALVFSSAWSPAFADSDAARVTAPPPPVPESERALIGRAVCGEGGFETTAEGVRCKVCPEFTGSADSEEGLQIGRVFRGRFSGTSTEQEWLLDTDGCEAHYENFGGAILLGATAPASPAQMPASGQGVGVTAKPGGGPPAVIFYEPGFRLGDCVAFGVRNAPTQLVCNEADMAQGEVVGHISVMEISQRGITRWRLLRWYDNSGTDIEEVVSIIPTGMHRVELAGGQLALEIALRVLETSREAYEKQAEPLGKSVNLVFLRKGQRFFAEPETQRRLEEISVLTRKMLQ